MRKQSSGGGWGSDSLKPQGKIVAAPNAKLPVPYPHSSLFPTVACWWGPHKGGGEGKGREAWESEGRGRVVIPAQQLTCLGNGGTCRMRGKGQRQCQPPLPWAFCIPTPCCFPSSSSQEEKTLSRILTPLSTVLCPLMLTTLVLLQRKLRRKSSCEWGFSCLEVGGGEGLFPSHTLRTGWGPSSSQGFKG